MPISTSNIALSELNTEPGGSTYSNMRFQNLALPGWNEGLLGSNSFGNYTWGLNGASSGADAIYGLTPTSGAFSIGDFSGLQYYFDGSTFNIQYRYSNNLIPPPPPFPPPTSNDVTVEFVITDSALNYSIFGGPNTPPNFFTGLNFPANTSTFSTQIPGFSPNTYPLVRDVYWIVRVTTDAFFGGGSFEFYINSTLIISPIGLSPGINDFDSTMYGSGLTDGQGILLEFIIS